MEPYKKNLLVTLILIILIGLIIFFLSTYHSKLSGFIYQQF
jgi:hypothetical protein